MNKDKMVEWIATHHVGRSSKTMWTALMGIKPTKDIWHYDIPYDADDFSRCYDLVKFCEVSLTEDFPKIIQVFPWYAPIIRKWIELSDMFESHDYEGVYDLLTSLSSECMFVRNRCKQ